jgi:hypothetical protein
VSTLLFKQLRDLELECGIADVAASGSGELLELLAQET